MEKKHLRSALGHDQALLCDLAEVHLFRLVLVESERWYGHDTYLSVVAVSDTRDQKLELIIISETGHDDDGFLEERKELKWIMKERNRRLEEFGEVWAMEKFCGRRVVVVVLRKRNEEECGRASLELAVL